MTKRITPLLVLLCLLGSCAPALASPTAGPTVNASVGTAFPIPAQSTFLPRNSLIDIGDGGLLSKQPCGPPCLIGITPGSTSKNTVLSILQEKINLLNCKEWDKRNLGGTYGIGCGSLGITYQDSGVVNQISFIPSTEIEIDDVIRVYGNPSGLFGIDEDDGNGNVVSVQMILYYDAIMTRLDLEEQLDSVYRIGSETSIEVISYLDQAQYEKSIAGYNSWQGFGDYLISTFPGDSK